jgi:hypothetical protein
MGIDEFPLAWRWMQRTHAVLPADVLASLVPMEDQEANALYRRGEEVFRRTASATQVLRASAGGDATRAWLKALPFQADERVSVVWSPTTGISLPWHTFVGDWDDFCYPSSDDAFVFPQAGSAVLAWNHYEVFEFSENAV